MFCNAVIPLLIWGNKSYFVNWGGLLCPPPRDLPNAGMEPESHALQADSLAYEPRRKLIDRRGNSTTSVCKVLSSLSITTEVPQG